MGGRRVPFEHDWVEVADWIICSVRSFVDVETKTLSGEQFCRVGLFVYVLQAAQICVGRCVGGWTRLYTRQGATTASTLAS